MIIIKEPAQMKEQIAQLKKQGKSISLVPTMGALHEGHLSLIDLAKQNSDIVVVSIFVNPTQFGPNEDFAKYPRKFENDCLLAEQKGASIIFNPEVSDIYKQDSSIYIDEKFVSKGLCGISRPTHFSGVATIVNILFNIVSPDVAVFGQKDAQQVALIKRMVRDLFMNVKIISAPIIRDEDGLAKSSRNDYLSSPQRADALRISKSLFMAKELYLSGVESVDRLRAEIINYCTQCRRYRIIYVEIVDKTTMQKVSKITKGQTLIVFASWLDEIRLIDNIEL